MVLLAAMQTMQIIPSLDESIQETVILLRNLRDLYGSGNPEAVNPAKSLARSLNGKVVAIYGSNGIMDSAAYRWRSQIAENAKNLAFHHVLPEMNHNELVGWQYPEDVLRNIGVVFLRDRGDHPQVQRNLISLSDSRQSRTFHEIWAKGVSLAAFIGYLSG
jgi:glucose/mannose-6-phosphate isomerase